MSDPIIQALHGAVSWTQSKLIKETRALTETELGQLPSPKAPPIGWHVWHVARLADMLQASMLDKEQHWKQTGLVAKFGLDVTNLGLLEMGATQSPEDASGTILALGQEPLIEYAQTVFSMTESAIEELTLEDLYRPCESILRIDWSASPLTEGKGADVILFNDLQFHMTHAQRHLGMIEALIGAMFEREGTATV